MCGRYDVVAEHVSQSKAVPQVIGASHGSL
jgi:hypothetical protein